MDILLRNGQGFITNQGLSDNPIYEVTCLEFSIDIFCLWNFLTVFVLINARLLFPKFYNYKNFLAVDTLEVSTNDLPTATTPQGDKQIEGLTPEPKSHRNEADDEKRQAEIKALNKKINSE